MKGTHSGFVQLNDHRLSSAMCFLFAATKLLRPSPICMWRQNPKRQPFIKVARSNARAAFLLGLSPRVVSGFGSGYAQMTPLPTQPFKTRSAAELMALLERSSYCNSSRHHCLDALFRS